MKKGLKRLLVWVIVLTFTFGLNQVYALGQDNSKKSTNIHVSVNDTGIDDITSVNVVYDGRTIGLVKNGDKYTGKDEGEYIVGLLSKVNVQAVIGGISKLYSFSIPDSNVDIQEANGTINISVTIPLPVNHPPVAVNDTFSLNLNVDNTVEITKAALLSNDTDPDNDPLTVINIGNPAHGTLTPIDATGYYYTPNSDFNGTEDTFVYTITDGIIEVNGTVTIQITPKDNGEEPTNNPPVAVNDTFFLNLNLKHALKITNQELLNNDSDPDNNGLIIKSKGNPANGILTANEDGSFNYTPNPGFSGVKDTFEYTITDGISDAKGIVTVQIIQKRTPTTPSDDEPVVVIDEPKPAEPVVTTPQPEKTTDTNETVDIKDEEIPAGLNQKPGEVASTLPKTGEIPPELFYMGGALLILAGAKGRKK